MRRKDVREEYDCNSICTKILMKLVLYFVGMVRHISKSAKQKSQLNPNSEFQDSFIISLTIFVSSDKVQAIQRIDKRIY